MNMITRSTILSVLATFGGLVAPDGAEAGDDTMYWIMCNCASISAVEAREEIAAQISIH